MKVKVYIKRNEAGDVIERYGSPQKGRDDLEKIDSGDPAVVKMGNPTETSEQKRVKSIAKGGYGTLYEILEFIRTHNYAELQEHLNNIESNT